MGAGVRAPWVIQLHLLHLRPGSEPCWVGAGVRTRSGFRFRIQSEAGVKEQSGVRGQNHTEPRSRGQSKHRTQHPHLRVQPRPQRLPLGSASWPSLGSSSPSLPTGVPALPFVCTPSWPGSEDPQVHLSAELSWEPSSADGPELVSPRACLQTVGVHGSASQPPSWARTAESKRRPLLSSSQPPSTPQMGRDRAVPACFLPQALLAPCLGPRGGAHSLGSQPWAPRRAGEGQGPAHHLSRDSLQP